MRDCDITASRSARFVVSESSDSAWQKERKNEGD